MSMPFNPALAAALMGNSGGNPMMSGGQDLQQQVPEVTGRTGDVPQTVTIPDTLAASLENANKHLIAVARGAEPLDEDSLAPQVQTFTVLMQKISQRYGNAGMSGMGGTGAY